MNVGLRVNMHSKDAPKLQLFCRVENTFEKRTERKETPDYLLPLILQHLLHPTAAAAAASSLHFNNKLNEQQFTMAPRIHTGNFYP